jgi:hypothetical protein
MRRIFPILGISLTLLIGGCSATKEIAQTTNEVRSLAHSSESLAISIQADTTDDQIAQKAAQIVSEQRQIQAKADYVASKIPSVKDNVPYWLTVIKWVAGATVFLVAVGVAWYTGILNLIAGGLRTVGLLIPHKTAARASLDAKAVVQNTACAVHREAIAASRATSKAYDSAFKRAKKIEESRQ